VPWGGAFGTPTPDGGFAARLVAARDPSPAPGEDRRDLTAALRAIASARASRFGRGPALVDVEVAETLLGVHPEGHAGAAVTEERVRRLRGLRHDPRGLRRLVAAIDPALLESTLAEVRDRVAGGEGPFGT
jgi:hypothetical protein